MNKVHQELVNLQKDKACGPDCVPAYLLQIGADFLANYSIVLCGDFNVPNNDWSLATPIVSSPVNSTFFSLVHDNFLTQLISSPTRGGHILDLILTNNPSCVSNVRVVDNLPGSDHDAVEFDLSVSSDNIVQSSRVLFNYSKADLHEFQEILSNVPWNCIPGRL